MEILFFNLDRKSTRLNSSHQIISYAVFCLKKKNKKYCGSICYRQSSSQNLNPTKYPDTDNGLYLLDNERHCSSDRNSATPHFFFFFNDTATTEIYTLSLHDALPI